MVYIDFKKHVNIVTRAEKRLGITKSGTIGFPTLFSQIEKLGRYNYILVHYSERDKIIGIEFIRDKQEGAILLRESKHTTAGKSYGYFASIKNFMKTNDLDPEKYKGKYHWEKTKISNVIQADKRDNVFLYMIRLNQDN